MPTTLGGVIAAALTPLDEARKPDGARFVRYCASLLASGCDGINVLGTTGEANSIGLSDRIALMEAVGSSTLPMERFMVGTGTCSIEDTVRLTRHAQDCGFAGALILPPFYYKDPSDDGLFAFFGETIERVEPRRIKVYLYNFPAMTGIQFSPALIGRLLAAYPGIVAGIKDSSANVPYERELRAQFPEFAIFPGTEALLAEGKRVGWAGCISATVNLTSRESRAVWSAASESERERAQTEVSRLRSAIASAPLIPAIRALTARITQDPVWERMLPPLVALPAEARRALFEQLATWLEDAAMPLVT